MTLHELKADIETLLPDFSVMCHGNEEVVLMHQDAFAAEYQDDEILLLGKAIKYAGLFEKEVRIVCRDQSTLETVQ